jgi:hypothetical protein
VYVGDSAGAWVCTLANDGSVSSCVRDWSGNGVTGISFHGNFAYLSDWNDDAVYVGAVATDGTGALSGCTSTGSGFISPVQTAVHGSSLYVPQANGGTWLYVCTINPVNGTLSGCAASTGNGNRLSSVAFDGSFAYINNWAGGPNLCALSGTDLINCTATATSLSGGGWSLTAAGAIAYVGLNSSQSLGVCSVAGDGTLTACTTTTVGGTGPGDGATVMQVALIGGNAYVAAEYTDSNTYQEYDDIYVCSVSGLNVSGCTRSDGGVTFNGIWSVAEH